MSDSHPNTTRTHLFSMILLNPFRKSRALGIRGRNLRLNGELPDGRHIFSVIITFLHRHGPHRHLNSETSNLHGLSLCGIGLTIP